MPNTEIPKDKNIKLISMHDEMSSSYLSYAMSVIVSRALPDVRDGLKPVHRRILFAMYKGGYDWSKQFRKSARIVGDVIGKYHPHGDQSVYDALVRMVQDFSMSLPLVEGQGNFGSIDGDPAAAMRYTETRLAKVSQYLIDDIEKNTIEYKSNYDETEKEPSVLPAQYPNLLVNGAGGIAVGMATSIPPHNLGEIIDGTLALIENKTISNPFDNKLVVVDEIHNLISLFIGGGYTTKPLYILLMSAVNLKIVFLSGTPAIQKPFELSVLLNLLHGTDRLYNIKLISDKSNYKLECKKILASIPSINYYNINEKDEILFTKNPDFYVNVRLREMLDSKMKIFSRII